METNLEEEDREMRKDNVSEEEKGRDNNKEEVAPMVS